MHARLYRLVVTFGRLYFKLLWTEVQSNLIIIHNSSFVHLLFSENEEFISDKIPNEGNYCSGHFGDIFK